MRSRSQTSDVAPFKTTNNKIPESQEVEEDLEAIVSTSTL